MMLLRTDYKSPDPELYERIQQVYSRYFKPKNEYIPNRFRYSNAVNYGYTDFEERQYHGQRILTADEYTALCTTHADHITIPEPYKSKFFDGLRSTIKEFGDKIVLHDTFVMYLTKKPL